MMNSKKPAVYILFKYALLLLLFAVYCCINPANANVQRRERVDNSKIETEKYSQLIPQELKIFEGYYQFQNDKDAYLQIKVNGKGLILKQLWDGQEIPFEQKSELEFICEEKSFPLKFSKDKDGNITQVLAFEKDLWNKVKDYKPVIKKEIQLSPEKLKAFEGKYRFQFEKGEDSFIQITSNGNGLVLKQLWDEKEISFVPESELNFFCKERQFPLKFTRDKNGKITQVLAFNKDLWERVE